MTRFDAGSGPRVKTLLLGLDGATMTLLSRLIEKGLLPNIEQLLVNGVYAPLTSTIPPFTAPAWLSIVTGVNPGRHGVYGFGTTDAETGSLSLTRTKDIGFPRLWQMVNAHGLSAGVVNVPLIYPPDPVDGFMLTGMLTPEGTSRFAYPQSMARSVEAALGQPYLIDLSIDPEQDTNHVETIAGLTALLRQRERAIHTLLDHRAPDFLMVVIVILDRLQHLYWRYLVPASQEDPIYHSVQAASIRPAAETLCADLDQVVGRLVERVGPSCRIVVVSDHGFTRYEKEIKVNNWLQEQGLLKLRAVGSWLRLTRAILAATRTTRCLARRLHRSRPAQLARRSLLDWDNTRAFTGTLFEQGIYINLKGREPHGCVAPGAEYEALRSEIAAGLMALRDPRQGSPLFQAVHLREEVYQGAYVERAPDLLPVALGGNAMLTPALGGGELVHYHDHSPFGCHHPDGILIAAGPGIRRGHRLSPAHAVDVTPTVLHSLGLPVPRDLDGHVILGLFDPAEPAGGPPIEDGRTAAQIVAGVNGDPFAPQSGGGEADLIERLRGLGYL